MRIAPFYMLVLLLTTYTVVNGNHQNYMYGNLGRYPPLGIFWTGGVDGGVEEFRNFVLGSLIPACVAISFYSGAYTFGKFLVEGVNIVLLCFIKLFGKILQKYCGCVCDCLGSRMIRESYEEAVFAVKYHPAMNAIGGFHPQSGPDGEETNEEADVPIVVGQNNAQEVPAVLDRLAVNVVGGNNAGPAMENYHQPIAMPVDVHAIVPVPARNIDEDQDRNQNIPVVGENQAQAQLNQIISDRGGRRPVYQNNIGFHAPGGAGKTKKTKMKSKTGVNRTFVRSLGYFLRRKNNKRAAKDPGMRAPLAQAEEDLDNLEK